jgi:hypothetical protein
MSQLKGWTLIGLLKPNMDDIAHFHPIFGDFILIFGDEKKTVLPCDVVFGYESLIGELRIQNFVVVGYLMLFHPLCLFQERGYDPCEKIFIFVFGY